MEGRSKGGNTGGRKMVLDKRCDVLKLGVDRLWPMVQMWLALCFCKAQKIIMSFMFLNSWEKIHLMTYKNYIKFKFQRL